MGSDKLSLRKLSLERKNQLSPSQRAELDDRIFHNFIHSMFYKNAGTIFIMGNFSSEMNTKKIIIKAIEDGKKLAVSNIVSKDNEMDIFRIFDVDNFIEGKLPSGESEKLTEDDIDLVLVPGLYFDSDGCILGYDGESYDSFFKKISNKSPKISLGYDFQFVNELGKDNYDNKIDGLITESHIHIFLKI